MYNKPNGMPVERVVSDLMHGVDGHTQSITADVKAA